MICGKKWLVWGVFGGFLLSTGAKALVSETSANPYEGISTRNVFALKPPLALTAPPDSTVPPSNITLCGITDILGRKQALLKAQVPPRPPAQPAKEESYILTEGQSEGGVEVLAIDQKAGTVKVNNHGAIQTLDFANNGTKLPAASSLPMAAVPGLAPVPVMAYSHPPPASGSKDNQPIPVPQQIPGVTADQQAVLIEAERERLQQSGDETFKLMPPTQFSEAAQ